MVTFAAVGENLFHHIAGFIGEFLSSENFDLIIMLSGMHMCYYT